MPGNLFTEYFLDDGIRETPDWRRISTRDKSAFDRFERGIRQRYESLGRAEQPNEAATEQDLIRPALELLGWADYLPQQGASRNEDIPDHLLFADADAKARATQRPDSAARYQDALLVQESKRLGLSLDVRERGGSPHGQILRYLATADAASEGRIRWGILTNGGVWRLYDGRARPRATAYYEADLASMLAPDTPGAEDALRTFYLLFRRDSFVPRAGETATFIEAAIEEGRRYEEKVAQDLSRIVFDRVFPALVSALARDSGNDLREARDAALIFLYRVLFVLYAEDRGLLPVNDSRYDDYGMRKRVRDDVAHRTHQDDVFSESAANYYNRLTELFHIIDQGDTSIGLPPYNGGLFSADAAPLLARARLSDAELAPIIYALSHTDDFPPRFVNYRDMSVQQLGSVYERLLEREPVRDDSGAVRIRPNAYARKDSGSFYTPQELVDLIVDRTLKPLADEREAAFQHKAAELGTDPRPNAEKLAELARLDPAEAVLSLKVLDPAMGSGHFLVAAVDFLSDYVAELVESASSAADWLPGGYESPLARRVVNIREDILGRARAADWVMDEAQLTDQAIIRRMVLKRCIYGVDKNSMTVELAKVSLWLHSFTVGAPLSFLDHHLRHGDSLIGLRALDGREQLRRLSGLFASSAIAAAETAAEGMKEIEEMTDADIAEAQQSATLFESVESTTAELRGLLDFLAGKNWLTAGMKKKALAEFESPLIEYLGSRPKDAYRLLAHGPAAVDGAQDDGGENRFNALWSDAKAIAERESFLHWEAAFPGVWHGWQDERPQGGFDAIISNPPWDRIKLQEVEWFATREPDVAHATTAAARRRAIRQLRDDDDPLADQFDAAKRQADDLSLMVRNCGDYPLLGRGDINIYSLFVERAMSLVKPNGYVGLLTPSGIYGDKTAARFFRSVSTAGRVSTLFDFENRKVFFKDVHGSFKFCVLVFGGEERTFPQTECAFFLHDPASINDPDRCFPLKRSDFARVNPNTGTAPVFRTQRDADITRRIYERHPVLVEHSKGEDGRVWPVKYHRMFDMTNSSGLFRTAAQLEDAGYYPVQGNRWKKGEELYLPLYEGKMVQAYDHRAASVVVNPENLNRPNQPESAETSRTRLDPDWLPSPAYWVPAQECELGHGEYSELGQLAFKTLLRQPMFGPLIAAVFPRRWVRHTTAYLPPAPDDRVRLPADEEQLLARGKPELRFGYDYVARQKVQGQTPEPGSSSSNYR